MTEILDEAKKYVELYKKAMDNRDTEGSIIYGLQAKNILEIIDESPRDEEEHKDAISLANEIVKSFDDHVHFDRLVDEEFEIGIKRFKECH